MVAGSWKYKLYRFFSIHLWGRIPAWLQRKISQVYASIYDKPFSRYFIKPYIWLNYDDPKYLEKFRPASGNETYISFQDFFIRVLRYPLNISSKAIWACEGLLCEYGKVEQMPKVRVKCHERELRSIFGAGGEQIPPEYFYANIFLHNSNYHRIHAPVSGIISRIEHIPGELVLLRPWIYQNDPSLPALRNERVNVDIKSNEGKTWFLSIVGGPAVGTIVMAEHIGLGSPISIGQELATFLLGSTCCIASPEEVKYRSVGESVEVGLPF